MTRLDELLPGDVVDLGPAHATYVAQAEHPIWPSLRLVVWRLGDGSWSHDALDARQDVGQARPATAAQRDQRLKLALLGRQALRRPEEP